MPSPPLPPGTELPSWHVLVLVVLCALPVLLGTRPLLVRLPEPAPSGSPATGPETPAEVKTPYAALPTRRLVGVCTLLAAAAAVLVGVALPPAVWPQWWVLCAPALVLVAVDARTTWLPLPLTRLVQAAAVGAAVLGAVLGGWEVLLRSAVGATTAGLLYLALWRWSGRALGFGDVRLAPVLGAAAAAVGWSTLLAALLLGSLVGAAVGLVRLARRRPGAFAYAPSMLAGTFAAAALALLSG